MKHFPLISFKTSLPLSNRLSSDGKKKRLRIINSDIEAFYFFRSLPAEARFYLPRYDKESRDDQSCCRYIFLTFSFFGGFLNVLKAQYFCQYLNLSLLSLAEFVAYPIA